MLVLFFEWIIFSNFEKTALIWKAIFRAKSNKFLKKTYPSKNTFTEHLNLKHF